MSEKRVLILHGLGGSDFPHWQAHLEKDLQEKGILVSFPKFPNRDNPKLNEWKEFLKKEIIEFKPNIVVCHSLGNVLWFHSCDELDIKLDKLMLVAPVSMNRVVEAAASFYPYPVPKDLKSNEIIMAASTNDPFMSVEEAIRLQSKLNIGMKIMEDAGHINVASGFGKLDCALDWILREDECEINGDKS